MKIAVYTIAKNEEQFVKRWADSCKDADYRLILDTGSTDNTVSLAKQAGVDCFVKQFTPWRFDVARNHALSLLPDDVDYCIALDMDEILVDGWRTAIEAIASNVTRPRYKYVWSWNDDGSEGLVYGGDKIHARHGYVWKHPVHEVLNAVDTTEQQEWVYGLEIHHHPDSTKSRGQYFDLLKLAVCENPNDDRNQFYLGREYYYNNNSEMAIHHLKIAISLSTWQPERAAAYRMIYNMTNNVEYLYDALMCDPVRRENLVALARYYYNKKQWSECFQFAFAAINITVKPLDYLCEADSWGWLPYDLAAVASWNLGNICDAYKYGEMALSINPDDSRLIENMKWYKNGFATVD